MYDFICGQRRRPAFLTVLLLLLAACSGTPPPVVPAPAPTLASPLSPTVAAAAPSLAASPVSSTPPATPTNTATPPAGPILGMVPASSVDDKGLPVNPRFSFKPDEPQVAILVQVGKIQDSPLTVTWYQEKDDGETKLFTHTIPVTSYDRAYSIGTNPVPGEPLLAPGEYKVVATLGGQTRELVWSIASSPPPAPAPGAAGGGTPQLALQPDSGVPPASGASGKKASPAQAVNPSSGSAGCSAGISDVNGPVTQRNYTSTVADSIEFGYYNTCGSAGDPVEVTATVNGETAVVPLMPLMDLGNASAVFPCNVAKGSDLPGTHVRLVGVGINGTQRIPDGAGPLEYTLGADTSAPILDVHSTPAGGNKVSAGDKIQVTAMASEKERGASWQTGVQTMQLLAVPGNLVTDWANPSRLPQACDNKTWNHALAGTYTVPPNPPAQFRLCVIAEDYAGNQSHKCATFHTGNTWKGSFQSVMSEELRDRPADVGGNWSCSNETWDGEFQVDVGANGDVQGKGEAHLAVAPKCSGDFQQVQKNCNAGLAASLLVVKGTFDGKQFHIVFPIVLVGDGECGLVTMDMLFWEVPNSRTPPDFVVPVIAPGDAEGQVNNSLGPRTMPLGGLLSEKGTHTFRLLCQDCK